MAGIFSRLQGENDSTSGTDVNHYDVDPAKAKRMCLVYFGQDNAGNRQWKIKGNDTHVGSDGVLKDADGRPIMPIYAYQIALADDNATYCQKKEDNSDSTDNTETTANPDDTETTPYEPYIPPVNNAPKTTPNVNYYFDRNGNLVYNDIADTRLVTDKTQLFAPPPPVKLKQPTPLPPNQKNIFNVTDKTDITDNTDVLSRTPYKDNTVSNKQQNVVTPKSQHNPETQSTATASSDKGPGTRVFKYHASDYNRPEYVHNDGSRNVFICYRLANVQSVIKILKKYSGKSDPFYIYAGEKDSLVNLGVWYDLDSFEHFAQRWMNHPYHVAAVDGHINLSDVYDITLNGAAWLPPLGEVAKGMNLYGNCILSSAVDDPIMVNQHGQSDVEGIAGSLIIGMAPIIMHELGKIKEGEYDVMEYKYLKNGAEHTGKSEGSNGPTGADYQIQAGFRIDDLRTIRGVVVDRHFLYLYYGNILLPGTGIKMEIPRIKNDYKYSYSEDGSIVVVGSPEQAVADKTNVPEKPKKEVKAIGGGEELKQDVKLITEKTGVTDTSNVIDKKPVIGGSIIKSNKHKRLGGINNKKDIIDKRDVLGSLPKYKFFDLLSSKDNPEKIDVLYVAPPFMPKKDSKYKKISSRPIHKSIFDYQSFGAWIFGDGDYRTDWTKTRLAPGGKVIVVDLKALNEIYQLVILGLIKEPDFEGVMTVDEKIEKLQKFIKDNPKEIEEAKKSDEWKKYLEDDEKRIKENELKINKINYKISYYEKNTTSSNIPQQKILIGHPTYDVDISNEHKGIRVWWAEGYEGFDTSGYHKEIVDTLKKLHYTNLEIKKTLEEWGIK